ncbi:hypothetical protein [Cupriavidus basilensis]|uniref:hypothetical protein n=1 Tax=Cupriavidus basilensis TaxID=68895 RepID=UPI0039F684E1
MNDERVERAAIAVCQVLYPEAWEAGKVWTHFPASTQQSMRLAASAALATEQPSEDKRDAERYRWLRSKTNCRHGMTFAFPAIDTIVRHEPNTYAARFDAAIDRDMKRDAEIAKGETK